MKPATPLKTLRKCWKYPVLGGGNYGSGIENWKALETVLLWQSIYHKKYGQDEEMPRKMQAPLNGKWRFWGVISCRLRTRPQSRLIKIIFKKKNYSQHS